MRRTGAQIVWEMLAQEGVEVVFGFPGGAVLDTYHCLQDYDIRHVLVRHEQGAAHAADGYARASGRVGVVGAASRPRLVQGLSRQGEEQLCGIEDPVTIANQTGGSSGPPTGDR